MVEYKKYLEEKGHTLTEWLEVNGYSLVEINSTWYCTSHSESEVNEAMANYNPWPLEKRNKWIEIQTGFRIAVEALTKGTIDTERASWAIQEAEARALLLDPQYDAKALRTLSSARNIPLDLLVQKVLEKADLYRQHYFYLQGIRDGLEDKIKSFSDDLPLERLEELHSIKYTV